MKTQPDSRRSSGFALVITLSLMILLTVVAVGLLSLSAISLRSTAQGAAMATAHSNARLALMLAIGDLQKSLGPDRAVSASSEILSATTAKPHTTGVWESWWDFNPASGSVDYTGEKQKRFRRWLVSNADPAAVEAQDFATSGWTGKTIELIGDNALGGNKVAASAKIVAGLVPVTHNGKVEGAFAWHVSDEAAKARINLYRNPTQNTTVAQKRAQLAGHRPDPSVMKDSDGMVLDCLPTDSTAAEFTAATATSGKFIDLDQVELYGTARGRIKPLRHDLTTYSLGLLTDVRSGAFKQDLSSVFEATSLPSEFTNKKLYASTQGITGISDPNWSALAGYYNIFRNITNRETDPTLTVVPPTTDVTLTTTTPPTSFNPGPVIAKVEIVLSFVVRPATGMWSPAGYAGHLILTPIVTLHNPYNISISFDQMDLTFKNVPVAFNFYVNGQAQNTGLTPLNSMYFGGAVAGKDRQYNIKIANWKDYGFGTTSATRTGPIIMKPGQTMVCGIYIDPKTTYSNSGGGDSAWTSERDLHNFQSVKASPGFRGRCFGYDLDCLNPSDSSIPQDQQSDKTQQILGLKPADKVRMDFAMRVPPLNLSSQFQVQATITSNGATKQYGGLSFKYGTATSLQSVFPTVYKYPSSGGDFTASDALVPVIAPPEDAYFKNHARAKTVAVFSAYAHTTNGGVYETSKRTPTTGSLNALLDGRLAGKPFLFNNPARTVVSMDLTKEKLGAHSHELNLQPTGTSFDDYLTIDATNRSPYLTGNRTNVGIKSGSYFELPTGPLQTIADFRKSNALTSYYLPNFVQPVGNSSVHPLMSTSKVIQKDASVSVDDLLDHSLLANHALYDRFYFSTFATRGSETPEKVFEQFMNGGTPLPCQAFQPYLPVNKTVASAKTELFASGKPTNTAYQKAAGYQMIRGPFNVNSTSVQAWKAVLGAMNKSEIVTLWARTAGIETKKTSGVPILGMSLLNGAALGGIVDAGKIDDTKTNEWNGYRELTNDELESLATKIVDEVRTRGPFLSMSEFVNRQVGAESDLTLRGALDAAIDKSKINDKFFTAQVPITAADLANPLLYNYKTPAASCGNPAAGAPGWISQGDLLRILEPAATVRGDTFVIRVCGEAWDPNGKVTARAYAEAVLQRVPEYIDPVDRPSLNVYSTPSAAIVNKSFGRRINLLSFRWLSSNEI